MLEIANFENAKFWRNVVKLRGGTTSRAENFVAQLSAFPLRQIHGDDARRSFVICDLPFADINRFQVEYDFAGSILNVTIVKCEDLAAMDIGGTSDPYVKVYLLPDRKRKQVRMWCVSPKQVH